MIISEVLVCRLHISINQYSYLSWEQKCIKNRLGLGCVYLDWGGGGVEKKDMEHWHKQGALEAELVKNKPDLSNLFTCDVKAIAMQRSVNDCSLSRSSPCAAIASSNAIAATAAAAVIAVIKVGGLVNEFVRKHTDKI